MNQGARTTGLIVAFILAFAAIPAIAAPAPDAVQMRAKISAYVENALATQGGSRIVFKVDSDALREAIVMDLRDEVFQIVHDGRIPFAGLALRDGGVEVRIANASDRQKLVSKLVPATQAAPPKQAAPPTPVTPTVTVTDSGDGLMRFMPTDSRFAGRLNELLQQSIEMIAQRLRDSGIRLTDAQPDEPDRIRIPLPGIRDPERVTAILSKRAHVAFRLVDVSMTPTEALKGAPPPGSEILYHFKSNEPYLVLKEIAMEGDDIVDVSPGFDQRTDEPITTFRFNGRGARRFAHITEENIGKPFAVVADDKVLSAPVIREPIRGGSGQIAGNLTLEDANRVAMLLRSGTLPGRLTVVDQQLVEPDANAAK